MATKKELTPEEYRDQAKTKLRIDRDIRKEIAAEPGPVPELIGYSADQLSKVQFEPRVPLLYRLDHAFLSSGQIAEVFATRGEGKTWFLLTLALMLAYGCRSMARWRSRTSWTAC
jgi:hypothetical protein